MTVALANPACDGLEFDIRGSREGVPILLHDETLERIQGRPERPGELTVAELAAFGVPTLEDLLATAGPGPFLDVELKGVPVPAVIEVLEKWRGPGLARTVVSSFEPETLAWVGDRRRSWPRWLNAVDPGPDAVAVAIDLGCRGISAEWTHLDERAMDRVRGAGLEVAAWTVRRRPTAARLDRLGVAAICVEAAALDG
jgi:glycerophosphoryl diester phosphodiesterase